MFRPQSITKKLIIPPDDPLPAGIDYFRDRLLHYLLLAIAGFGSLAYLPSIYYGVVYRFYGVVLIDTLALVWIFSLLVLKSLSYERKCIGLLGVFYVLGVWLLISLGPTGAGFMWMLLFSVMTGVFLGFRAGVLSFAVNVVTMGLLSIFVVNKVIVWDLIHSDAMAIWAVKGMNFLCVNAIVTVSTGFLITKISWMAKEEQERRVALAEEMEARLKAEAEKKELTDRLYQAQKMEAIGTLAGGVAHDFNNILSSIMGYTELTLMEPGLPGPARDNLDRVIRAAERAKGITHQILTFSRHAPAHKSPVDLGQIARECVDFLKISTPAGITLSAKIPDQAVPILGDRNRIHQVIMNLLTNGLQAMAPSGNPGAGPPVLSLSLGRASENDPQRAGLSGPAGTFLALTVSDTGGGISPEHLPRIFEPYFTTKAAGKGTGMGLSISHGIVRDHGGGILVRSIPGKGSTFTVLLPRHARSEPVIPALADAGATGDEHILMVDDEPQVLFAQEKVLSGLGYRVTACPTPFRVLEVLAADPDGFHLLITDRKMDGMDGVALCREVRSSWPELPVILCSGFPEKEDEDLFDAILVKPVKGKEMASVVRQVLDRRKRPTRKGMQDA